MKKIEETVSSAGEKKGEVEVALSNELVTLLSDQLYQSPTKAIEELVVNSYDAEASECRLYVPAPSSEKDKFIVIYDDGTGMSLEGLKDLWHIGSSKKRSQNAENKSKRKQIGRFGIGKLATYTVANQLSYITKNDNSILSVSLDFRRFAVNPQGSSKAVELSVFEIDNWDLFKKSESFSRICKLASIDIPKLEGLRSWTIAVLEDLKPKSQKLALGRLKWILETAMPLRVDFKVYLNAQEIHSSKETSPRIAEFDITELPEKRIEALNKNSGLNWRIKDGSLVSEIFPSGVKCSVILAEKSLLGKSDDLGRSHGFFVKVRGRLVSEDQPAFGIEATSYQTFYRFRADITADDLDEAITAPREGLEDSAVKDAFKKLLESIFNEARIRYEASLVQEKDIEKNKKEHERNYVSPRLVERPIADVLSDRTLIKAAADADGGWFYLDLDESPDTAKLISSLYVTSGSRTRYRYESENSGRSGRLVKFNPSEGLFTINEDHPLARNYPDGDARDLLEDIVTSESLLEIYLREARIPPTIVGEILEKRDTLWRSLVSDHPYSLSAIATSMRDSVADERDLEISVVAASRALGFVATHLSGAGEPDGIARFTAHPDPPRVITLEAKSSGTVPSLSALDFAGLHEHMIRHNADGCLLVAPSYPGLSREEDSAASARAVNLRISCWTVEQLASVVDLAESRQITAKDIIDLILNSFSPDQVSQAVSKLLNMPSWGQRDLNVAVLDALIDLDERLPDANRTVDLVAGDVSRLPKFKGVKRTEVLESVRQIAASSQGGITLSGEKIFNNVSFDEVRRRLINLTATGGDSFRNGTFREK